MAITRSRKEELIALYGEILQHSDGFITTEYKGLSVALADQLRTKLRDVNGAYVITKNTLFGIALKNEGWTVPQDLLAGPVATAFSDGNMPGTAKALLAFAKDHPEALTITGAVMGGEILTPEQVKAISELPTLDELRSQLAGIVVQPATGLVSILNAATSSVVNVLHAYVQENSDDPAA